MINELININVGAMKYRLGMINQMKWNGGGISTRCVRTEDSRIKK